MRYRLIGLFVFICGCANDSKIAPVVGKVTLDKVPLSNVSVVFQPIGNAENVGPGSAGRTDQDGRFELIVVGKDDRGAVIGKHRVTVTTIMASSNDYLVKGKEKIPRKYNTESELSYDVPASGFADLHIDLVTTGK